MCLKVKNGYVGASVVTAGTCLKRHDGWTYGQTYEWMTDRPTYRDARKHLKIHPEPTKQMSSEVRESIFDNDRFHHLDR